MSEYEGIQLVKCDPPALLYSTIANTRLTRNWCESIPKKKVSCDVLREGGCGRGASCFTFRQRSPAYGHGAVIATECCKTKGVFGEWVCAALL